MPLTVFRILVLLTCLASWTVEAAPASVAVFTAKGSFEDVKDRVVMAIENRGLVLNYTARIGDMLERTGKDLGRTTLVYGKAEMLEFCSSRISRDTMEADPHNIAYCPYAIAIYTLPKERGRVYVSYRKTDAQGEPSSVKALRAVDKLLEDIAREATR